MKQHQFVDETFEDAHDPLPKGLGDRTIKLHHFDHAIQGIFQSEEVGRRCFFNGISYQVLYNEPGYFPYGWFDACDLFDKWSKTGGWNDITPEERTQIAIKSNLRKYGKIEKMNAARKLPVTLKHLDTKEVRHFDSCVIACQTLSLTASALSAVLKGTRPHHKRWSKV